MIVPAARRYVPSSQVLKRGFLYSVDSHMGGSYTIQYKGFKDGQHHFVRPRSTDVPRQDYRFAENELVTSVYINPPQESFFESSWDQARVATPHFNSFYKAFEGWFPPAEGTPSYKNLVNRGLLPH